MSAQSNTVALVEDDQDLRETLGELIDCSSGWELVGSYPDGEQALEGIPVARPRVVLMDIQLPGMSGIECVARLKQLHPEILFLMVTVYDNNDRVFEALAAGASGYLLKSDAPDKLIESLDDLLSGGSPMSSSIARKVVRYFRKEPPAKNDDLNLTRRETQILELLVKGRLYKEIAADLGIGFATVHTHLQNVYSKLHVRTRTEAVLKYIGHSEQAP